MLPQIRSFLVVIEEGSLNRAAVRLRMSQPALTRQMQALESEVGGRLLERTSSGVSPTDAGHALAAAMPDVLARYDDAIAEARRLARGQRDQLRVGYLVSAAQSFLNPALSALRRSHPDVKVTLMDLSPGEQVAALRKGEIDLAIIGQEGCVAAREFYTRSLATLRVLAILPVDHPLALRKEIRLEELRGERFISSPEDQMPGRDRWIVQLCRRAGGFKPRFVQEAASVSHLFTLIASEGAVTLAPSYMRDLPSAGVAMVPIADEEARWDFLVVWQKGRASDALRALVDTLSAAASGAL